MRKLIAGLVLIALTSAAHGAAVAEWRVNLLRGSSTQGTLTGATQEEAWSKCQLAIPKSTPVGTYTCQTPRFVAVVSADAPPPPPPPVDCVVSDWSEWVAGAWSSCTNGTQSRQETRVRTVLTPPANGGQACAALNETRTATATCVPPPPADQDGDGIPDSSDECPHEAGPAPSGCPVVTPPPSGQVITVQTGGNIGSAIAQLLPGGTVVIKPGTYASLGSLKACTAAAWCTVRAETDGTVTINALGIGGGAWYTRFEGLKFVGGQKSITGSYLKFFRTAFVGGPSSGNTTNLVLGTNDRTPGSQFILLEDCWLYGAGGRYKVLVYNSSDIVLRRVIARHDGGWTYDNNNPQAGITSYNSKNVRLQNVLVVDSLTNLPAYEASIYLVGNGSSSTAPTNVRVRGAIVIGGSGNGIAFDDQVGYTNSAVEDSAIWNAGAGGFAANGGKHVATVQRVLAKSGGTAFADWAAKGGITVKDSIAIASKASSGVATSNVITTAPQYIARPVGTAGPTIEKRIGVSGTLFGEAGFDDVTSENLWPFPNEARIKSDFDSVRAAFGGKSLTKYVWEQAGQSSPY